MANDELMELTDEARETARLIDSIDRRIKRLTDNPVADLRQELLQNTYPLLKEIVKWGDRRALATEEQMVVVTEQVEELNGEASVLIFEEGAQLAGVITLARALCQAFKTGAPADKIGEMIEQLEPACDAALALISELTMPQEEGDDEEEENVQ